MKILIMWEGPNELEIVRLLIANHCLIFNEEDLLNLTPFHTCRLKKFCHKNSTKYLSG